MRVDPKHLRGFHQLGLSVFLVIGTGGLMGLAGVSSLWQGRNVVETIAVSSEVNRENSDMVPVSSSILPSLGSRLAVFVFLPGGETVLLFSEARVNKITNDSFQLDLNNKEKEIMEFAQRNGKISYSLISPFSKSPYKGEDITNLGELQRLIR